MTAGAHHGGARSPLAWTPRPPAARHRQCTNGGSGNEHPKQGERRRRASVEGEDDACVVSASDQYEHRTAGAEPETSWRRAVWNAAQLCCRSDDGYYHDYHLQADVCRAYHILRHHGVPDDNVVVMMYDDIAYNPRNPTLGIAVNYFDDPSVTASNFLNVLQRRRELIECGSGKVGGSGPKDHIFVYLNGPGARGLVSFSYDALHAEDLTDTIKKMHDERKYARMVFYLYASFSGSMFDGLLPDNISMFATTAADSHEEACPSEWDDVRGVFAATTEPPETEFFRRRTRQEQF
ncbi:hypothetical protein HPB47_015356 [Ixodes persulcatus]|uniref:Uncharacterized protein n=1 Tax=Ixodes persulcatus TaxID=34615 RepID=A0AC60QTP4_IXOPE|nr:hypothetical protein HPB47_015356 [Ixodes persulcatus]